jgi:hypothetical protein
MSDTENENQNDSQVNYKALWIGLSVVAFVTIIGIIFAFVLVSGSPSYEEHKTISTQAPSPKEVQSSSVPTVENQNVQQNGNTDKATFTAKLKNPLPSDRVTEYQIRDADKKIVSQGVAKKQGIITAELPVIEGDNSWTLRIRVSTEKTYSQWVAADPQTLKVTSLPTSQGMNTELKPNEAYFNSNWAKGEGGNQNFETAMKDAWGIDHVSADARCASINVEQLKPGQMIPPTPSVVPDGYYLSYEYQAIEGSDFVTAAYYWCEK